MIVRVPLAAVLGYLGVVLAVIGFAAGFASMGVCKVAARLLGEAP